ncbi:hypothetical protein [Leeuwenhoekiella marinoflava]|uniref:Uncharacterized protein n=2 Tax=Leeuwenhoekiella marinoflava TaxID=988 RepID=A0A4Q0PJU1_9FLAO|nr:hypothetical protein [Leeuwenhoekiella marinoflava]RXG27925.1 hypothetical protein DSL99_2716 [Leeuwenhoekiella marinoflava]SHF61194.1 hypothetical protein SAMN02745246_02966 [Leeuwenhoekiella marinoflava DSM 3653]
MKLREKAAKGGILLATFGLISFLAIMHFLFDSFDYVFKKEIIGFFLIACIINYTVSIIVSNWCLTAILNGKNSKLMGLAFTLLSLGIFSLLFNIPYFIYECITNTKYITDHLTILWASPVYCFIMGFIPAVIIGIPYGLYLDDDLL